MADRRTEKMKEIIWDLDKDQQDFMKVACDPDEDPEVLKSTWEALEGRFLEAVDWYGMVYETINGELKKLQDAIDRLTALKKARANGVASMKWHMLQAMINAGIERAEGTYFALSTRKDKHVVITGPIPERFLRFKEPEPDKRAISEWLKEHDEDWARFEESTSLTIR